MAYITIDMIKDAKAWMEREQALLRKLDADIMAMQDRRRIQLLAAASSAGHLADIRETALKQDLAIFRLGVNQINDGFYIVDLDNEFAYPLHSEPYASYGAARTAMDKMIKEAIMS
jgi:hypothetical protein